MTRYNNPLPHTQAPPAQGRPAGPGHPHQPHLGDGQHHPHAEPELSGWPQPAAFRQPPLQSAPLQHRPAQPGYPDLGYPEQDAAATQDPFAALRPDGYGASQQPQGAPPADPYGRAGYASPQPAPQGYAPPRQAPAPQAPAAQRSPAHPASYDPFALSGDGYAPQARPAGYSSPAFGTAASLQANGYEAHARDAHAQDTRGLDIHGRDAHGGAGQGYAQPPSSPGSSSSGYAGYASPAQGGAFGAADTHLPPQPLADQWGMEHEHAHAHGGAQSLALDAHDYQAQGGYGDAADHGQHAHWGADSYGEVPHDEAHLAHGHYQGQQHGGTFDQSYADDDALYEDEPRRAGWKKAATLVACAVLLGGGLVYGASGLFGPGGGEAPPLVKGAEGPSKVKPSEPGGKRFDHADSKIMGRLGEGAATADPSGVRKVPVVSVGRDGQIQPPSSERDTQAIVAVPGLTVIDGLGGPPGPGGASPSAGQAPTGGPPSPNRRAAAAAPPQVEMVTGSSKAPPAEQRPAAEKSAAPAKAPSAPKADAPKKMAAADPSPAPRASGAGYVAVLASVPASASSRIDALTQFADMQQKYGAILSSKTPDIQEANLGAKGTYHRLLVGPPGSRDSANSVCNQLKAQGYNGCWITAY